MTSYKFTFKDAELNAAIERTFKDVVLLAGVEFTRVITEPRTWEGFEGARDIVDTGQLRSSQQLTFTSPLEAVYSWPIGYALYVHEGYTLRNGREVKGRPWTQIALQEFDVEQKFTALYAANLRAIG